VHFPIAATIKPLAAKSNVPACPTRFVLKRFFIAYKDLNDVMPEGLSIMASAECIDRLK
jgi:hypothetical protein